MHSDPRFSAFGTSRGDIPGRFSGGQIPSLRDLLGALADSARLAIQFLFPHWCRLPFCRMHLESLDRYDALTRAATVSQREGRRFVLLAPRGYAKSALHSTLLPLLDLCFSRERFIVLISATRAQAEGRLRAIREELATNATLRLLFPHLQHAQENNRRTLVVGGQRISAYGAGCELRGIGHLQARPTKIVLDDVEDSSRIFSAKYREAMYAWYQEVVEPLGDATTHIEIVATLLHTDSLVARLAQRPHIEVRRYSAIESWARDTTLWQRWHEIFTNLSDPERLERARAFFAAHERDMLAGACVLWPEKESYLQLMEQYVAMGRTAFFKEKQNEPPSGEGNMFAPETWPHFVLRHDGTLEDSGAATRDAQKLSQAWNAHAGATPEPDGRSSQSLRWGGRLPHALEHQLAKDISSASPSGPVRVSDLTVVGYLDPSLGKGDWAAIATVGHDPRTGILYVLDLWLGRVPPAAQVARAYALHRQWRYTIFGYEAVGFQQMLEQAFAADNRNQLAAGHISRTLEIRPVKARAAKQTRIAAMEPLIAAGWLRFAVGLPEELDEQARAFPCGRHDDALDALAGAVELARSLDAPRHIRTIPLPSRRTRR
jgi:predicted phage terminase large subunit-like protein